MLEALNYEDGDTEAETVLRQFFAAHQIATRAGRGVGCTCGAENVQAGSDTLATYWVEAHDIDAHRAVLLAEVLTPAAVENLTTHLLEIERPN